MPFALILIGLILIIAAARGTLGRLGELLKEDLTGNSNFLYWIVAIGIVGMIGYAKSAEKFSRAFLALILLAMILRNGKGFFSQLMDSLKVINAGTSSGSGSAGNTLDNSQPAKQSSSSQATQSTANNTAVDPLSPALIAGQLNKIVEAGGSRAQILSAASAIGGSPVTQIIASPVKAVTGLLGKIF